MCQFFACCKFCAIQLSIVLNGQSYFSLLYFLQSKTDPTKVKKMKQHKKSPPLLKWIVSSIHAKLVPWLTVLFPVTGLYLGTRWVWYHSTSVHQRHHSVHTSMHCWQEQWIQQGYNQTWPPCPARIPSHRYSSTLHLDIQGQYRLFLYRECKISLCIHKDK